MKLIKSASKLLLIFTTHLLVADTVSESLSFDPCKLTMSRYEFRIGNFKTASSKEPYGGYVEMVSSGSISRCNRLGVSYDASFQYMSTASDLKGFTVDDEGFIILSAIPLRILFGIDKIFCCQSSMIPNQKCSSSHLILSAVMGISSYGFFALDSFSEVMNMISDMAVNPFCGFKICYNCKCIYGVTTSFDLLLVKYFTNHSPAICIQVPAVKNPNVFFEKKYTEKINIMQSNIDPNVIANIRISKSINSNVSIGVSASIATNLRIALSETKTAHEHVTIRSLIQDGLSSSYGLFMQFDD